jgi:hypothetical protein
MFASMLLAAPAMTAEIHRCVAGDGTVSYQDVACDGGSRHSRTIAVRVDAGGVAAPKHSATTAKTSKTSKSRPAKSDKAKSAGRSAQRATCATARKTRDANLRRLGLNRTFDQLRALDDAVGEACRGL